MSANEFSYGNTFGRRIFFSAAGEKFLTVYAVYTDFTLILYEKIHLWLVFFLIHRFRVPGGAPSPDPGFG